MPNKTVKQVDADVAELKRDFEKHEEWINGNGNAGAKEQLAVIKEKIKRVEWLQAAILAVVITDFMRGLL